LNTSNILSPDIIREQPLGIKVLIYFETKGKELYINNLRDVNFTSFKIEMTFKFALDSDNNLLVTHKDWIKADVSTDAAPGYRRLVENGIESGFRDKIYGALYDIEKDTFSLRSSGKTRS